MYKPWIFRDKQGVHLVNRKIKLHTLTPKDLECIVLAKRMNIKNFALSFTNSLDDIKNSKIYYPFKIEFIKLKLQKL